MVDGKPGTKYFAVLIGSADGISHTVVIATDRADAVRATREAYPGITSEPIGVVPHAFYRARDAYAAAKDADATFRMALAAVR